MRSLYFILEIVDVMVAIWFIFIVAIQSSKSEGLGGGGNNSIVSQRAKPGFEEGMSRMTLISGVAFMALTTILTFINAKLQ